MKLRIAIIEDEKINRLTLESLLVSAGHEVRTAADGNAGMDLVTSLNFDLILSDIKLPGYNGMDILQAVKEQHSNIPVIMMTGYATVKNAVDCLKLGAYEYLTKPFQPDELLHIVAQVGRLKALSQENRHLKVQLAEKGSFPDIIGNSDIMLQALEKVKLAAPGDSTILLQGGSGTGKELFADAIQKLSSRKNNPFVRVNCSALNESLFESEMFGHEKGAFTGAHRQHIGRFERARGGTIFLDDIDDLSSALQTKLLRVIQEREIERVGGMKTIPVDIRFICATKTDLKEKVQQGNFREDFFYRISVVTIQIPSLMNRKSDIPLLAEHFIHRHDSTKRMTPALLDRLTAYHWPGNVRELQNVIEQICTFSTAEYLEPEELPEYIQNTLSSGRLPQPSIGDYQSTHLETILHDVERDLLQHALTEFGGNQKKVADYLGIPRTTLRSKLKKFNLV